MAFSTLKILHVADADSNSNYVKDICNVRTYAQRYTCVCRVHSRCTDKSFRTRLCIAPPFLPGKKSCSQAAVRRSMSTLYLVAYIVTARFALHTLSLANIARGVAIKPLQLVYVQHTQMTIRRPSLLNKRRYMRTI